MSIGIIEIDKKKAKKVARVAIPAPLLVCIAIGVVAGWAAIGGFQGIVVGAMLGILTPLVAVTGIVPFFGWWIYEALIDFVFTQVGYNMPLLWWFGAIIAGILCIITSAIILVLVGTALYAIWDEWRYYG